MIYLANRPPREENANMYKHVARSVGQCDRDKSSGKKKAKPKELDLEHTILHTSLGDIDKHYQNERGGDIFILFHVMVTPPSRHQRIQANCIFFLLARPPSDQSPRVYRCNTITFCVYHQDIYNGRFIIFIFSHESRTHTWNNPNIS